MASGYQARLPAAAALLLAAMTFARAEDPQPQPQQHLTCTLEAGPTRSVVRVIDAETVLLDDEEVRLIGALAPRSPDLRPDAQSWPPEQDTAAALRDLVVGRSVELATSGRAKDRYEHLLAHLFLDDNGDRVWVQGRLLSTGHARAYGLTDSFACARELLAHERVARAAGIGLWANAAYATRKTDDGGKLLRYRNSYQIVEGSVVRVKAAKARTYLDFGRDWRTTSRLASTARFCAPTPNGPRRWPGSRGGKSRCAVGSNTAAGPTSPSRTRASSLSSTKAHRHHPHRLRPVARCSAASGQMGRARTSRTKENARRTRCRASIYRPPSAFASGGLGLSISALGLGREATTLGAL
ncbi:MAG: thermonuclease family protein [Hyphomicrobium sp.]